jgi:hypothetical protein
MSLIVVAMFRFTDSTVCSTVQHFAHGPQAIGPGTLIARARSGMGLLSFPI